MSFNTTPASVCGRVAAISIAIRPPSEVPIDDDALDRQLAQQRPHVIDIGAGVIVHPVRVVLRAAAAALIGHDHAARGSDVLGERSEVAAVAREPVQAQHRRFARIAGVVAVVELQPVARAEELFGESAMTRSRMSRRTEYS